MGSFIVVAAIMAALAAAVVGVPLLRDRQSRRVGVVAAVVVAAAAAALYPLWSTWNWHAPTDAAAAATAPDVKAMIAKLESHLRDDPNDLTGWLMLGRSYLALERVDDATVAYDHAHRLDARNVDAVLGLGEAMSLGAGGNITPAAGELFEQAVKLAPDNPKALLYSGFAAAARGDNGVARARWQALKDLHPPQQIEKMLDARIAELGPAAGTGAAAGAGAGAGAGAAGAAPVGGMGVAAAPPAESGDATINLSIAPQLKSRLAPDVPLFVFAREPGGQGPPLAAKRLTTAAIGTQVHLGAADSMIPGRVLVKGRPVSITARVSFGGKPLPTVGDLYGELTYDVGQDGVRNLVIDRVAQ